jgi:hypothetical protein
MLTGRRKPQKPSSTAAGALNSAAILSNIERFAAANGHRFAKSRIRSRTGGPTGELGTVQFVGILANRHYHEPKWAVPGVQARETPMSPRESNADRPSLTVRGAERQISKQTKDYRTTPRYVLYIHVPSCGGGGNATSSPNAAVPVPGAVRHLPGIRILRYTEPGGTT